MCCEGITADIKGAIDGAEVALKSMRKFVRA